jgi:hypothetical protein
LEILRLLRRLPWNLRRIGRPKTGKIGEMSLEVCDFIVGVSLAQLIAEEIPVDVGFDSNALLHSTRTMALQNMTARRPEGHRGSPPKVGITDSVRTFAANQTERVRSRPTSTSKWRFDAKYRRPRKMNFSS